MVLLGYYLKFHIVQKNIFLVGRLMVHTYYSIQRKVLKKFVQGSILNLLGLIQARILLMKITNFKETLKKDTIE